MRKFIVVIGLLLTAHTLCSNEDFTQDVDPLPEKDFEAEDRNSAIAEGLGDEHHPEDYALAQEASRNWEHKWMRRQKQKLFAQKWQERSQKKWKAEKARNKKAPKSHGQKFGYQMIGTKGWQRAEQRESAQAGFAERWQKKSLKRVAAAKARKLARKAAKKATLAAKEKKNKRWWANQMKMRKSEAVPLTRDTWQKKWKSRAHQEKFAEAWQRKAQHDWRAETPMRAEERKAAKKAPSWYGMIGTSKWRREMPRRMKQAAFARKWTKKSQKHWNLSQARKRAAQKKAALLEAPGRRLSWKQRWAQRQFYHDWTERAEDRATALGD